jgi:hypothetical protein
VDTANLNLVFRGAVLRPDRTDNPVPANRTLGHYFDISAFNPGPASNTNASYKATYH